MSGRHLLEAWEFSAASGSALLVLLALAEVADRDGLASLDQREIAARSRMNVSTVATAISRLKELGEIEVEDEPAGRRPAVYRINMRFDREFARHVFDDEISAGETGASHERLRVFIVAHRNNGRWAAQPEGSVENERGWSVNGGEGMANSDGWNSGPERQQRGGQQRLHPEGGRHSGDMGNAQILGRGEGRAEPALRGWGDAPPGSGGAMADAERDAGHQGGCGHRGDTAARGQGQTDRTSAPRENLLAPGPSDRDAWERVLRGAPSLKSAWGASERRWIE